MRKQRPARAAGSKPGGVTIGVRVQPRASKNGAALQPDGSLKVRLTAPPVDGAANEALVRFLAETFNVGRSQVEIVGGHTGRNKVVRISGISGEDVRRLLNTAGQ
jgi:uncharacterized protein (TIGR00251 family)